MKVIIGIIAAAILLRIGWYWGYLCCRHDECNNDKDQRQ